jgi:hypothetical protein
MKMHNRYNDILLNFISIALTFFPDSILLCSPECWDYRHELMGSKQVVAMRGDSEIDAWMTCAGISGGQHS